MDSLFIEEFYARLQRKNKFKFAIRKKRNSSNLLIDLKSHYLPSFFLNNYLPLIFVSLLITFNFEKKVI